MQMPEVSDINIVTYSLPYLLVAVVKILEIIDGF